jgi:hypothetical protein
MGEIVGIAPRNAVKGDVELPVLEAADADVLAFRQARAVGRGVEYAGREFDRFVIVGRRWQVLVDEILGDDRGGLDGIERRHGGRLPDRGGDILFASHGDGFNRRGLRQRRPRNGDDRHRKQKRHAK